jgi:UDP-glucose 4-epimerase
MHPQLQNKRFIVTGGCGFIGTHMVERLLSEGAAGIVIIDSREFGTTSIALQDPRIELIVCALEDARLSSLLQQTAPCDYLIHLAARKHNQNASTAERLFASNIGGTERIIALAAQLKIKRAVFSSSLYAYGRWAGPPMREDDVPHPNTLYGVTKLAGEHLFGWGLQKFSIPYAVVRYFFAYGPGQFPGLGYKSVIIKNFERISRGEAPIIRGDGKQQLDYIYVTDVVEGTLRALLHASVGEVFNISSGIGTSVENLTARMYEAAGADPLPVQYEPKDETDGSSRVGDPMKARTVLAFAPQVSLREGLTRTYAWVKNERPEDGVSDA